MARPTKLLAKTMDDLPENWRETIIEHGKLGYSIQGLYTKIGLTKRVHDRFMDDEEEYKEFISYALDLARSYWIDEMGRKLATDRSLNSAIYAIQVRNRYGWRQQDEVKPTAPKEEKETPVDDLISKHKKTKPEVTAQTTN